MSLVKTAHASLINAGLRSSSNALVCHLPVDADGQDRICRFASEAEERINSRNCVFSISDRSHGSIELTSASGFQRRARSILDGQLVAVKDNIWTKEFPTTCASAILQGFQTPRNSTVVGILESGGVKTIGKTNMDEFGMGSHSTNSTYGPVKNDSIPGGARSAGGSSGGSAMAVRNGQCRIALGTDTGGSVRLPAAYTRLVGFKPSYGRLSRYGVVPYANSLDTVGLIGRDCEDIYQTFSISSSLLSL
jgi:Asp-tRNA(Asn)/Glu-tRNA(Gln) amidotransferase A subunit family amidase